MSGFVFKVKLPILAVMLLAALLCSGSLLPAAADDDAPPGGFPSWQEVENVRQNEGTKTTEITRINELLGGLQTESEKLGTAAVAAAAEYAVADSALTRAKAKVEGLTAQTGRANAELARYRKETGALAVQAYKNGATNLGFFAALDAIQSNSLQGLNVMQIVTDKTTDLVNKSAAAEKTAQSLADHEQAAKAVRERLAGEAKEKLDAAQTARHAMDTQIAQEQRHGQELTAQLASLKGTTAEVEGQYREGQAALAAYASAQAAKSAAAEEQARRQAEAAAKAAANAKVPVTVIPAPSVNNPVPPAIVSPAVPGGAVNDPAGAQSYASARSGAYGWGQDQFQCLVKLWTQESSWLTTATNPSSGAYGIAQALPPGKYASAGNDWISNYHTQIDWGLGYIRDRYSSPCGAWNHEISLGWY
ncbi:coiled-coil domain-containing protein [Pseudarthrobacter sp. N5]|uniref:coiled-coil domain-containing protein n=1 Tax=Pseudarthrobacter sp. N5 TaxID=3418416 RepID=UPI003CE97F56